MLHYIFWFYQFFFLLIMDKHKGTDYWQILPLENNRRKRSCSYLREKETYFGIKVAKIQWVRFNLHIYLYEEVCSSQVLACELFQPFCNNMVKFQDYLIFFFLFNIDMKISLNVMFSKVSETLFSFHDPGRKTFLALKNMYCLLNGFAKEA